MSKKPPHVVKLALLAHIKSLRRLQHDLFLGTAAGNVAQACEELRAACSALPDPPSSVQGGLHLTGSRSAPPHA